MSIIRIAVAHAKWLPERKASLARLEASIGEDTGITIFSSAHREHSCIWARRLWEHAALHGDTICLNDDVTVHPQILDVVHAMREAQPGRVISLHANMPEAVTLARQGHRWLRCYWLTGPGYFLPQARAQELLAWVDKQPWDFVSRVNEDNTAIHWSWSRQEPIWVALPALVKHDASVPSSLGYDKHPHRVSEVTWEEPWIGMGWEAAEARSWRVEEEPPLVDNYWLPPNKLAITAAALRSGGICSFCGEAPILVGQASGSGICRQCLAVASSVAIKQSGPTMRDGRVQP